jgi:hypothetical protein
MHLKHPFAGLERNRLTVLADLRLQFGRPHSLTVHPDGSGTGDASRRAAATATAATSAAPSVAPAPAASAAAAAAAAIAPLAPLAPLLASAAVLLTARLSSLTEPAPWAAVRP